MCLSLDKVTRSGQDDKMTELDSPNKPPRASGQNSEKGRGQIIGQAAVPADQHIIATLVCTLHQCLYSCVFLRFFYFTSTHFTGARYRKAHEAF